jgi:hypothetical protein
MIPVRYTSYVNTPLPNTTQLVQIFQQKLSQKSKFTTDTQKLTPIVQMLRDMESYFHSWTGTGHSTNLVLAVLLGNSFVFETVFSHWLFFAIQEHSCENTSKRFSGSRQS